MTLSSKEGDKMIKLNFEIESHYWNDEYILENKKYSITREYREDVTFKEILLRLYDEYGIDNKNVPNIYISELNKLMWHKYFDDEICNYIDYELVDYWNHTIGELEEQFGFSNKTIDLALNLEGIGACVGEIEGITFEFHTNERDIHHNAHIHCTYSGVTTRVEIETLKILDKPFKKSKMNIALDTIKKNQKALLNYWNKVVINGESMKFKMEI